MSGYDYGAAFAGGLKAIVAIAVGITVVACVLIGVIGNSLGWW